MKLSRDDLAVLQRTSEIRARYYEDAVARGDYDAALSVIGSHERPGALFDIYYDHGIDYTAARKLVTKWWTGMDALGAYRDDLLGMLREIGPLSSTGRTFTEPTTIYRGNIGEDPRLGLSWTLSKRRARWFALYALSPRAHFLRLRRGDGEGGRPTVWRAIVQPETILGYFADRGEWEIVPDPDRIDSVEVVLRPRRPA